MMLCDLLPAYFDLVVMHGFKQAAKEAGLSSWHCFLWWAGQGSWLSINPKPFTAMMIAWLGRLLCFCPPAEHHKQPILGIWVENM